MFLLNPNLKLCLGMQCAYNTGFLPHSYHCCGKQALHIQIVLAVLPQSSDKQNASFLHVTYYHLWPVRLYHIFPPYLTIGTIFEQKVININYVVWFSLQICLKKTFTPRIIQIHITKYKGLCVKNGLILSDINKIWVFSTDFRKILKYQNFMKICQVGANLVYADRQTDMTEASSRFPQFCEIP